MGRFNLEIEVDVQPSPHGHASVRGKEGYSGGDGMGLDFRLLTLVAGNCPLVNVSVDSGSFLL